MWANDDDGDRGGGRRSQCVRLRKKRVNAEQKRVREAVETNVCASDGEICDYRADACSRSHRMEVKSMPNFSARWYA